MSYAYLIPYFCNCYNRLTLLFQVDSSLIDTLIFTMTILLELETILELKSTI